jgi:uncharacterized membrane protein YcaP (DUF421 family)
MGLLRVGWHTVAVVLFLLVGLRTVGRRALSQLQVADLIVILLLGSAVETAMVAGQTSLASGFASAAALLALNRLLNVVLSRHRRLREMVCGLPILLVHDGNPLPAHLEQAGLSQSDLDQAIRERGQWSLADVREVILEPNGAIHVLPRQDEKSGPETPRN